MKTRKPKTRSRKIPTPVRPFHELVGDDELAAWSDEDKIKLDVLEAEFERDGPIAVERMREKDPVFFVQLAALLVPDAVRKALEDMWINEGLTDAEIDNVLLDPRSYKVIWKAMQFEKVQAGAGKAAAAAQKVVRPGASGERMPQATGDKLNFNKAMKQAKTSGEKARVIETRLEGMFAKGRT